MPNTHQTVYEDDFGTWTISPNTATTPTASSAPILNSWGALKRKIEGKSSVKTILQPLYKTLGYGKGNTPDKLSNLIGIEIENEFKQEPNFKSLNDWKVSSDSSLRYYGIEFVSRPLYEKNYKQAVTNLSKYVEGKDHTPTNSIRTSVHVHLDVSQLSFIEVLTFACIYWTLEEVLSSYAGDHRKGNLFCLRLKDALGQAYFLQRILDEYNVTTNAGLTNDFRYGSLNFSAIRKFGTIENRLMRGTFDVDTITTWVDSLLKIKEFSLKFKHPGEFRKYFIEDISADRLPEAVFGSSLSSSLLKSFKGDLAKTIRECFTAADEIMGYCDYDFESVLKKEEEEEALHQEKLKYLRKSMYTFNSNAIPIATSQEDHSGVTWQSPLATTPYLNNSNFLEGDY